MAILLATTALTPALAQAFAQALTQGANSPVIIAPTAGQVLQGQVAITGTTDIPNFSLSEVDFAYPSDPTYTWFFIQSTSQPISNGTLANWDTSSITDGDYVLRLRVTLQDGTTQEMTVAVQVRNYTIVATPSPTATQAAPMLEIPTPILLAPSETPTPAPLPPPSALPPNPATVTPGDIYGGFWHGALAIAGMFILIGIVLQLRRRS